MKRIADIKKVERCEKLLWLSKRKPIPFTPFIYYQEDIYKLAKMKLNINECFDGNVGDDNDVFFQNEEKYQAFIKMRFTYKGLRIRIPLMVKVQNRYKIYFLYAACFPKESEAQSFADQIWVLKNLGIKIDKVYTIHLNSEYVRQQDLDVDSLLLVNEILYNDKNHEGSKIKYLMKHRYRDLLPVLHKIDDVLAQENIFKERTNICTRKNKCPYFDVCFPTPSHGTSILNLVSCAYKFKFLDAGINDIAQINIAEIEGTRHQFAQVMAAKNKSLFFDTYAVEHFFASQIKYPISYLDFEWETYAFPPFEGMKPFDVLTFQYSLHIETVQGTLTHKEYLGKGDCRKEFIVRLLNDIPKEGSVMCFNVDGAEKLRLRQLAHQFPEYESELQNVWERMIDLSIPFSNGLIYDNRMAGMYSLKKLVSIFTNYNYEDLDISHGIEAVRNYRMMEYEDNEEQEKTRKELLEYCAMDTYAEYLIYHWIMNMIKEKKKISII